MRRNAGRLEYLMGGQTITLRKAITLCDGLQDGQSGSSRFREFLANLQNEEVENYLHEALSGETGGGKDRALQDLVNEVGRRLGYRVEFGRYHGVKNAIGHDGIWAGPNLTFILETKTTSAYSIDVRKLVKSYLAKLKESGHVPERSFIIIAVGRMDTLGWEDQIRGAGLSNIVRVVGIDKLISLLRIKTDANLNIDMISSILQPTEYVRLDGLIDLTDRIMGSFIGEQSASVDLKEAIAASPSLAVDAGRTVYDQALRIIAERTRLRWESFRGNMYVSDKRAICLLYSKEYDRGGGGRYWYAIHSRQLEAMRPYKGTFIFICGPCDHMLILPAKDLNDLLPKVRTTSPPNKPMYHHIDFRIDAQKQVLLRLIEDVDNISKYRNNFDLITRK